MGDKRCVSCGTIKDFSKNNKIDIDDFKKFLESQGCQFDDDGLWMEDRLSEYTWADIFELFISYVSSRVVKK